MTNPMTLTLGIALIGTAAFGGSLEDTFKNPPADAEPAAATAASGDLYALKRQSDAACCAGSDGISCNRSWPCAKWLVKYVARCRALLRAGEPKPDAPALEVTGTDAARQTCRTFKDGTVGYFVACPADVKSGDLQLSFAVADAHPELWDPATGSILRPAKTESSNGKTVVTWHADPGAAVFVMLRPSRSNAKKEKRYAASRIQEVTPTEGAWTPAASGTSGTYEFKNGKVHLEDYADAFWIDFGKASGTFEVKVNGKTFPPLWKPPYRLDIVDALSFEADRHTIEPGAVVELDSQLEITVKANGSFDSVRFESAAN